MSSSTSNDCSKNTDEKSRKRKGDNINMSTASENIGGLSSEKKNRSDSVLHGSSNYITDNDFNFKNNTELVKLSDEEMRRINKEFNTMYDKQIEKVQHLLDNVKRSSAMKYRLNLRKLIDEMKNRAVVALQIKETKRTHVLHAFKVKEELIKQNYKHYADVAYGNIVEDLENKIKLLNDAHRYQNP